MIVMRLNGVTNCKIVLYGNVINHVQYNNAIHYPPLPLPQILLLQLLFLHLTTATANRTRTAAAGGDAKQNLPRE